MRVFAGPNGSGKTTIVKSLKDKINYGVYVNADDIESLLFENNTLDFNTFKLKINEDNIQEFF